MKDEDPSYEAVARLAVQHLKGCTKSSSALGSHCKVHPRYLDAALAPLVQARKLVRIIVLRDGASEHDYRYGATWVPVEADFALCTGGGSPAPYPSVSVTTSRRAESPRSPPPPAREPTPALPATPAHAMRSLGWAEDVPPKGLDAATLDAVLDQSTVLNILEADDLVCAINSRGELAIDLGAGHLVKFPPAQALILKRFLGGTTVLEDLYAKHLI